MSYIDPDMLKSIVTELLSLVLLVLAGLSSYVVKLFADKLKVTITDAQQTKIRTLASEAIFYAEEMTAKEVADGYKGNSAERKSKYAWQFLKNELHGVTPELAERAIHAALGQTPGLGASKAIGIQQPVTP